MKALCLSFIVLLIFFFSLGFLSSEGFSGDSSQQAEGGFQLEKIIIAVGLIVVISLAFLKWEGNAKKNSNKSENP